MMPLVDVHCHLCAGLDDGPRTDDEALAMCQVAWQEGTRWIAATAHQNERWPQVTPAAIRAAVAQLVQKLRQLDLPLMVHPSAEVMIGPALEEQWRRGELLSLADRGTYLLMELPAGLFLDLRPMVRRLREMNLRPVLAHPERHPELLHGDSTIDELVRLGCLVQVSSDSLTDRGGPGDLRALKRWVRRGIVHLVGSDGHSPRQRAPRMAEAYHRIAGWAGASTADRICSTNGLAVLQGLPFRVPRPEPARRRWFSR